MNNKETGTSDISFDAIDIIKTGIIILDSDKCIIKWNQWMESYTGITRAQAIGNTLTNVFPAINNIRFLSAVDSALKNKLPAIISNVFNRSPLPLFKTLNDPSTIISQAIDIIPVTWNNTNHCIIQTEDITAAVIREKVLEEQVRERKEAEVKLRNTMGELQQALNIKGDFLASMSHEIRTPLNGIIGMAQLLASEEKLPSQSEYIETILNSGKSLLSIINDILDFSKIEAGKLNITNENLNLRDLIEQVIKSLRYEAEKKSIKISLNFSDDYSDEICGDSVRLKQILLNLVSNAIKFTESGSIKIHVDMISKDTSSTEYRVSVTDSGIGISETDQEKLFEKFTQADVSTTRKYGGTGLGLAICKQLVNLMHGSIGVTSKPGSGSTFWFQIKFSNTDYSNHHEEHLKPEKETIEQKYSGTVLVVDDVRVNQIVATKILQSFGLKTMVAENGLAAIDAYKENKFDLILMDCHMPLMDGYEATKQIRMIDNERHTPIIAVTAMAMESDRSKCIMAGMDDYLSKPYVIRDLKKIVDHWLLR
jgi:signal transduction histidine kinase